MIVIMMAVKITSVQTFQRPFAKLAPLAGTVATARKPDCDNHEYDEDYDDCDEDNDDYYVDYNDDDDGYDDDDDHAVASTGATARKRDQSN